MTKQELKLIKDAERYRFLRGQTERGEIGTRQVSVTVEDWAVNLGAKSGPWSSLRISGKDMDREIDAAMRKA